VIIAQAGLDFHPLV